MKEILYRVGNGTTITYRLYGDWPIEEAVPANEGGVMEIELKGRE